MTRRPFQIAALALVGLSLLSAACSREAQAPAGEKRLKLAFVTNNASDFWTIARAGTEKADEDARQRRRDVPHPRRRHRREQKQISTT